MSHVYFPTDSIFSLQYVMENGASTAILVVGNEGLLGITLFLGGDLPADRWCRAPDTLIACPGPE